jgi:hypothetical protein
MKRKITVLFFIGLLIGGVSFWVGSVWAEQSGSSPDSGATSYIKAVYDSLVSLSHGSDSSGAWGDWGAYWNRIRSAGEWVPDGDATASDVASGATFYSDSRTQETGTLTVIDYSTQKNLIYDDWKGSGSCAGSLADAYGNNQDQCKEEGSWTEYTDGSLDEADVASGTVYKDERTGLYWSDCYSTSPDGSCDAIADNDFSLDGVIDNSLGEADDGLDAEGGAAVNFCEGLELDADGANGDDENWYLPSQKELMQAYINGAANNIPNPNNYFWSSSEHYNLDSLAWRVYLANGTTRVNDKSNDYDEARCVRRD